jgi:G3E family GTPase
MGIESSLMKDADGNEIDDFYEMPNGCICCSATEDIILVLDTLLNKKRDIEYIIVEANGLADPSQVIRMFWIDDGLGRKVELHQTIGIVDAFSFDKKLTNKQLVRDEANEKFSESDLLLRQLVFSDKILLNKVDLIQANHPDFIERIRKIKEQVALVNPNAQIVESVYAKTPLDFLIERPEATVLSIEECKDCHEGHTHHHDHRALESVQSVYINLDSEGKVLDRSALEQFLGSLIWEGIED